MAHFVADRIRETCTTPPGTGSITLAGAVQGFRTVASVLTSNSDTGFFHITNGTDWEVFLGTRTAATTLARTTVFSSSNGGALVNFTTGTLDVVGGMPARFLEHANMQEITVASAATTDIGAANGYKIAISGTTTITSLGTATHKLRAVRFTGALVLTHNATTLILPGAANITTVPGETAIFGSDGSGNWRCYQYQRFRLPTRQIFTSGSGTYTTPAGALWIEAEIVGGGGGGLGSGTGGGVGTAGGNTTFSTLTANGGSGASSSSGGAGGSASGGDINITGGTGAGASTVNTNEPGGMGGNSNLGGAGGNAAGAAGSAAATNSGSGGGGGGTSSTAPAGGGGGAGGFAKKLIVNPSATYSYSVGAGGGGGAAGTGGFAGAAGAAGIVIVTEYYNP